MDVLKVKSNGEWVGIPAIVGEQGPAGPVGATGAGVPSGGTNGQILMKDSNTDYDTKWSNAISDLQDGLAIVSDDNTHAAIGAGQFVYVKNHTVLADGLYINTSGSEIAQDATLSNSNLTADASGGLNALKTEVNSLNGKIDTKNGSKTMKVLSGGTVGSTVEGGTMHWVRIGDIVILDALFWAGAITGANSNTLQIELPWRASQAISRYYGTVGYNNTGVAQAFCNIDGQTSDDSYKKLTFTKKDASTGATSGITGSQVSGKYLQCGIVYVTDGVAL